MNNSETPVTVRMAHLRRLGYCSSGVREFFERHSLDYPGFLANGIRSDELLSVCGDDIMVQKAVEIAYEHG